jgi:hypothetical protein
VEKHGTGKYPMTPPRRFSGLTTVPDAGPAGCRLTHRPPGTIGDSTRL